MPVIAVENLKYRYPNTESLALDGLSFTVEKGEFIGIVGENGAGKSTLSQALIGLVPQFYKGAYGGRVLIEDLPAETTPISELCCKVGLVFQNPFNQLSGAKDNVYEEVAFGMQNLGVPREEMHRRAEEALKLLDIWQYRDRNPFDLSGGQMQRVAIASVLVMNPDILVLDEPTSQLDPQGSEEVFRTVDKLARSGITILMIEQKIEKIAAYCDRILLLHKGRQIAFDTPQKIFSRTDLEELGVQPPAFTRICRALGAALPDGSYPVTAEEAAGRLHRVESIQPPPAVPVETRPVLFEIEKLRFSYRPGTPVLHEISLTLDARPTAIIGQNGAGKTTLVKLLKGLRRPEGGVIRFRGEDIAGRTVASLAAQVGYVFQNPDDQIFRYNVLDEVMFGPLNIGMDEKTAREKSREALAMTGLAGLEDRNPYDLELYERKMVAIASVLAMDPDVLILDEPTIAQDVRGRRRIAEIVRTLSQRGKLVLAILHDMDFVAECFERVIVMAQGRVVAEGTPRRVFSDAEALQAARPSKIRHAGKRRRLFRRAVLFTSAAPSADSACRCGRRASPHSSRTACRCRFAAPRSPGSRQAASRTARRGCADGAASWRGTAPHSADSHSPRSCPAADSGRPWAGWLPPWQTPFTRHPVRRRRRDSPPAAPDGRSSRPVRPTAPGSPAPAALAHSAHTVPESHGGTDAAPTAVRQTARRAGCPGGRASGPPPRPGCCTAGRRIPPQRTGSSPPSS